MTQTLTIPARMQARPESSLSRAVREYLAARIVGAMLNEP